MDFLLVGAGAALGALSRWLLIGLLSPHIADGLTPLLIVNAMGSYAMGRLKPKLMWGTGFLGGFTSFSSFAVILLAHDWFTGVVYFLLTAVTCVGGWYIGDRWAASAGKKMTARQRREMARAARLEKTAEAETKKLHDEALEEIEGIEDLTNDGRDKKGQK